MKAVAIIGGLVLGMAAYTTLAQQGPAASPTKVGEVGVYACPIHTQIQATWPARCPLCQTVLQAVPPSVPVSVGVVPPSMPANGSVVPPSGAANLGVAPPTDANNPRQEEEAQRNALLSQQRALRAQGLRNPYLPEFYRYYYGYVYPRDGYAYGVPPTYLYPGQRSYSGPAPGYYYNPGLGSYYNPNTGFYYYPNQGYYYNPNTGQSYYYSPYTGQYYYAYPGYAYPNGGYYYPYRGY
jgi:hypothetical protein